MWCKGEHGSFGARRTGFESLLPDMVKSVGDYKIPYDDKGNLQHYGWSFGGGCTWHDNHPFKAEMEISTMASGRSSKYLIWQDVRTKRQYPMFVVDTVDLLKGGSVTLGRTPELTWTVRKRGQNFGIALLTE